ncbi:glycosyltransferase [Methanococcoides sp. SA1]|nr:glycosyltransferase [Methanococcoides sp. SA1]
MHWLRKKVKVPSTRVLNKIREIDMNNVIKNYDDKKLISCIVPLLNEAENISNFIHSLHQQDYRPIELILVDGGSNDGTIEIVNSSIDDLTDKFFQIKLFYEKNFGTISSPANARNIGLDVASGEFVFFIDSDTCFINENTISSAISDISDKDFIIIYFKPLIDTKLEEYISKTINADGILIYRKDLIENIRFIPTLGFGEDQEFNYRLFGTFSSSYQNPDEIFIGRHYPHTKEELRKQNEWYGRTILRYLNVLYPINKNEFLKQLAFVIYNLSLAIYPLVVILSLIISLKLTVIIFMLMLIQILMRFFKYGFSTLDEYIFLIWYSFYSGIFFTKGLISNVYTKNIIGRT